MALAKPPQAGLLLSTNPSFIPRHAFSNLWFTSNSSEGRSVFSILACPLNRAGLPCAAASLGLGILSAPGCLHRADVQRDRAPLREADGSQGWVGNHPWEGSFSLFSILFVLPIPLQGLDLLRLELSVPGRL